MTRVARHQGAITAPALEGWPVALWLPYPPSVNKAFRNVSGGGRRKTYGYAQWRTLAAGEILVQRPQKLKGFFELMIAAARADNRKRDIDNLIKPIADALVAAGVVVDDSQMMEVRARWTSEHTKGGVFVWARPFAERNEHAQR